MAGIKYQAELEIARAACKAWQKFDPAEVQAWRLKQKQLAEVHEWSGGWSASKELLAMEEAPSMIVYAMARGLVALGWHPEAARNWDRTQTGNKWGPSELWKLVVNELLPEAKTARKERRLRNYSGVDLASS